MLLSVFLLIRSTFAFIEELQFCEQMCMNADEEMDYTHSHTHTHTFTHYLHVHTPTHSLTQAHTQLENSILMLIHTFVPLGLNY
jgi:hypothetical protein